MDVHIPRKIKWIEHLRDWWQYRKAVLTISVNEDGLIILGGVINQRIRVEGDVGIADNLLMRKSLHVSGNLRNASKGTFSPRTDFTLTTGGTFTMGVEGSPVMGDNPPQERT